MKKHFNQGNDHNKVWCDSSNQYIKFAHEDVLINGLSVFPCLTVRGNDACLVIVTQYDTYGYLNILYSDLSPPFPVPLYLVFFKFLNVCRFDYKAFAVSGKVGIQ